MKQYVKLNNEEFENLVNPAPSFQKVIRLFLNLGGLLLVLWFLFFKLWDKV
jgi:hypothetical protein